MVEQPYWTKLIPDVIGGRVEKPRISGLTMVIDTGQPVTLMRDLFELASKHIDFWKFGFASAAVCTPERIMDKVTLCQEYEILAYAGGTSLEIMLLRGDWRQYMRSLWKSGIRVIEVSDGTVDIPIGKRREMIREAKKMGFMVLSEVGKKSVRNPLGIEEQAQIILGDIAAGSSYVIVEGREAGLGVGMYDDLGNVKEQDVDSLMNLVGPYKTRLIWEAPLAKQQTYYLNQFGNHINFGNVRPMDVITLESLRRGLRSDTFRTVLGNFDDQTSQTGEHQSRGFKQASTSSGTRKGMPTLWNGNVQSGSQKN